MNDKPDFVWENLQVGMTIGERSLTVTQEMVDAHCDAVARGANGIRANRPMAAPSRRR